MVAILTMSSRRKMLQKPPNREEAAYRTSGSTRFANCNMNFFSELLRAIIQRTGQLVRCLNSGNGRCDIDVHRLRNCGQE